MHSAGIALGESVEIWLGLLQNYSPMCKLLGRSRPELTKRFRHLSFSWPVSLTGVSAVSSSIRSTMLRFVGMRCLGQVCMCVNEFAAQGGFLDSLLFFKELPFGAAFLGQMQPQRRAAPCHAVLHLLGPARRENP